MAAFGEKDSATWKLHVKTNVSSAPTQSLAVSAITSTDNFFSQNSYPNIFQRWIFIASEID